MNDPPPSSDEARDQQRLADLAGAREAADVAAEREALGQLIAPYWDYAYAVAFGRLASSGNRQMDAEDIAAAVISRLLKALAAKTEFGKPFWKVAYDNLIWELNDYHRARGKNKSTPHDPSDLSAEQFDTVQTPPATEAQIRDFRSYLEVLGELDRQIVTERILLDLEPEQIARNHGMSVGNVYTRLSRSLSRLRGHPGLEDVRNRKEGTA